MWTTPSNIGRQESRAASRRGFLVAGLAGLLAAAWLAAPAAAEPMDLTNAKARWVSIRFEMSPPGQPGQTNAVYIAPIQAWLEPADDSPHRRVIIARDVVEARLLEGYDPVPGTFSDYVWAFDAETGHVLSAALAGTVNRTLDWGIVRTHVKAKVSFRMDTLGSAGYRKPRSFLGQPVNYFCEPGSSEGCVAVAAQRYDAATGYVNAVGTIEVESLIKRLRTFSTIGEAIFSEIDGDVGSEPRPQRAASGVSAVVHTAR